MQARSLTAAALLILVAACATTWTVDKYEAPEAGLANRRTYAWKGGEIGLPNDVDPALLARLRGHGGDDPWKQPGAAAVLSTAAGADRARRHGDRLHR